MLQNRPPHQRGPITRFEAFHLLIFTERAHRSFKAFDEPIEAAGGI
jgi:hypothetical protein